MPLSSSFSSVPVSRAVSPIEALEARQMLSSTVWNVAKLYSSDKNPNGLWTYGSSLTLTGAFTKYSTHEAVTINGVPILEWHPATTIFPVLYEEQFGNSTKGTGPLPLHPGVQGQYCDVQFVVPSNGSYSINTTFIAADKATTDVHILENGKSVYDNTLTGLGAVAAQTVTLTNVTRGMIVTFAVGYGSNGNESYDTTQLAAIVTQTYATPTTGTISGTVFYDHNADGKLTTGTDGGESGWLVYIDSNGDHQFESGEKYTTTDKNGNWSFTLSPGTYDVAVQVRSGFYETAPSSLEFAETVTAGASSSSHLFGVTPIAAP